MIDNYEDIDEYSLPDWWDWNLMEDSDVKKSLTTENTEDLRKESLEKETKDLNSTEDKWVKKLEKLNKRRDPDGIEKDKEKSYSKEHLKEMIQEHKRLVKVLENDKSEENKKEYDIQKKELDEYIEKYKAFKSVESDIEKAKYIKREGSKGKYKYIYRNESKSKNSVVNKIQEYANKIITGDIKFNRLSPQEEFGRIQGGRANVEATILAQGSKKTNRNGDELDTRKEQEKLITSYAKKSNLWIEDFEKEFGKENFLGQGFEAKVYFDEKDQCVYKVHHYPFEETYLNFSDRIAVHNRLFPESQYEVVGFTERKKEKYFSEDKFSIVLKQRFIKSSNTPISQKEIDKEMFKRGFKLDEDNGIYFNEDHVVYDLHPGNVLKTKEGNFIFIDPICLPNTKEAGFGGDRKLTKSQESDIEKSQKSAQIGEVRIHADGKKYKKVNNTGNKNKDWKLVTSPKDKQEESDDISQKGNEGGDKQQHSKEDLKEQAKNTSETALNNAIKESDNPEVRQAAHEELDRREKEKKPQEESEKKDDSKSENEAEKNIRDNFLKLRDWLQNNGFEKRYVAKSGSSSYWGNGLIEVRLSDHKNQSAYHEDSDVNGFSDEKDGWKQKIKEIQQLNEKVKTELDKNDGEIKDEKPKETVKSPRFGEGEVLWESEDKVGINFKENGYKELLTRFAKLERNVETKQKSKNKDEKE